MNALPNSVWARVLVISCYIIIGILSIYFLFSKLFAVTAPFIFALAIGRLLQNPISSLEKRLRLPRRLIGFVLTLILILFLGFVTVLISNQLISEAQNIFEILSKNSEKIINSVSSFLEDMGNRFPFIYERLDEEVVLGTVTEAIKNVISTLSAELAQLLTGIIKALPGIMLFFAVFVLACFYFSMDYYKIKEKVKEYLPRFMQNTVSEIKEGMRSAGIQYIKAYSIIMLVNFALLFIGFLVIGIDYALIIALGIALLDMLPVLGMGTILVPWAVIQFLFGNTQQALNILAIFGIISLVREIIEPKVVGNCMGMHPLLTLISMYAGYKFFGVLGIILLPPTVMIIKSFADKRATKI